MNANDLSFVEANDLHTCVDVETDIPTSVINMLDERKDIERRSIRNECDTLFGGSMEQSKQLIYSSGDMAGFGRNSSGPGCHGAQLNPSTADSGETAPGQHAVEGIGELAYLTGQERSSTGPIPHKTSTESGDGHRNERGLDELNHPEAEMKPVSTSTSVTDHDDSVKQSDYLYGPSYPDAIIRGGYDMTRMAMVCLTSYKTIEIMTLTGSKSFLIFDSFVLFTLETCACDRRTRICAPMRHMDLWKEIQIRVRQHGIEDNILTLLFSFTDNSDDILLTFRIWSGAKVCKSCRSRDRKNA